MRNLVIIRAGDHSLHPTWPGIAERDWSLVASCYGGDRELYRDDPRCPRFDHPGGKFEGIHALLTEHPALLADVDYVWLPDDDIEIEAETVSRLFRALPAYGLALAQPALSEDSFVNVPLTRRRPGSILRRTNYVEMMAPCFKKELLLELLPLFGGLRYGWALDHYWGAVAAKYGGAGIFDVFTMKHTREPMTGELYARSASLRLSPVDEAGELIRRLGVDKFPPPQVTGVVLSSGVELFEHSVALERFLQNSEREVSRRRL
jgi:hypothetical protein